MTTTDWFKSLSREERKAIINQFHELRVGQKLESHQTGGLMLQLLRKLDDDHEAAKGGR